MIFGLIDKTLLGGIISLDLSTAGKKNLPRTKADKKVFAEKDYRGPLTGIHKFIFIFDTFD